jgi:cytochrome b561
MSRFGFARKGRFRVHGFTMAGAVGLHLVTILVVMIPTFTGSLSILVKDYSNPIFLATWIHAPLGFIILVLGIYLILDWRFRKPTDSCFKKAKLMRYVWLLWVLDVLIGLMLYISIAFY